MVVKRAAQRAGLDPARYAGHSLRSGLADGGRCRRYPRAHDYEADRPPQRGDGASLYQERLADPGECRGLSWTVISFTVDSEK